MHLLSNVVCVTGASSGIGLAVAQGVPVEDAKLLTVARRAAPVGEALEADLADPAAWPSVTQALAAAVEAPGVRSATLLHFAGAGSPHAPTAEAEPSDYARSVLLNAASGPILGQAFLRACIRARVRATVVLCSSPGAASPMPGMSHYGSGKLGMEYWVRSVAAELEGRHDASVFAVVPYAVDTPMVREVIGQPVDQQPVAAVLREAAARGALAGVESVAQEIWRLVLGGTPSGSIVAVGAVPGTESGS